jgi:hypothetical protein
MGASGERTGIRLAEREWIDQVRAATTRGMERTGTARQVLDLLTAAAHARASRAETAAAASPGSTYGPAAPRAIPDAVGGAQAAPRPGDDHWTRQLRWATEEASRALRS